MLRELAHDKEFPLLIASMPASAKQRTIAFGVVIFFSALFAVAMPFATTQIARIDSFILATQSIVLFADVITGVFLFAQFAIQRQLAVLVLASGYIFSGLFAFLQTLDFPGAYSANGLISGTPSGAVWLFSFWRITFPLAVIAYVSLKDTNESGSRVVKSEPNRVIGVAVACVFTVTAVLTWIVAAGYLPTLYTNATLQTFAVQYFAGAMWLLNALAILLLFLRMRTILDLWLIVAVYVAIPDLGLAFFYPVVRFSVGWYMAKIYILIASCTVLVVLLWETTVVYARLASAIIMQRRERSNRLMSVEAATAAIAHEINQPLAAISVSCSAALNWLKNTPPDLEEVRACLTGAVDETVRAGEVVTGIRRLFKSVAPRKTLTEINQVVRQVLSMVQNDLRIHGITVSTELQEGFPQIMADPTQLQQAVLNLVKNAIEAMAAGAPTLRSLQLVTTQDANSVVSLKVQDTGPGINAESQSKIFDPFFTTKSSGMGLGLSISQKLIEEHDGELRLITTKTNGCTFEIILPPVARVKVGVALDKHGLQPSLMS